MIRLFASSPSFPEVVRITGVLAVAIAIASLAQYAYVSSETTKLVLDGLRDDAQEISQALKYKNGRPDLRAYNKAFLEASTYVAVDRDGTVLDAQGEKGAYVPDFIPKVSMPWQGFTPGAPFEYMSPLGERWLLAVQPIDGGFGVAGVSEYASIEERRETLVSQLKTFPPSVQAVATYNPGAVENDVDAALITTDGRILRASGRLPFRMDPMEVGRRFVESGEVTSGNGLPYRVLYSPLTSDGGNIVGTVIGFKQISQQRGALAKMQIFSVALGGLLFSILAAMAIAWVIRNEDQRTRIRAAFQNYFSPQILQAILKHPESLRGQRREVTIMFSDIRAFTALSETLPATQLTRLLEDYFREMTEEVYSTGGVVDKFIGDAIMAFWGAPLDQPDHADRAVTAAIGMVKRLQKLRSKWSEQGYPDLDIGIGINLGVATVGNIGSEQRVDYTVVGDVVNVASRLESLNKEFGSHIIISDATRRQLTLKANICDLGEVPIRGRHDPVHVFEVRPEDVRGVVDTGKSWTSAHETA